MYASGLIAGAALLGVLGAAIAFFNLPFAQAEPPNPAQWQGAAIAFTLLSASLLWLVSRSPSRRK